MVLSNLKSSWNGGRAAGGNTSLMTSCKRAEYLLLGFFVSILFTTYKGNSLSFWYNSLIILLE
jgi:hypothetical protein